ncbi:MAG: NADH-quinone oxidoreductase subunit C [Solirubrobacterales bacterium]
MPDAPGLELIVQKINEAHPGAAVETAFEHDRATLIVDPDQVLDVLRWLRDTPEQEYRFLASLHAADYLPGEPRFAVHYELLNMPRVERLSVKALLADPASSNGSPRYPRRRSRGDGGIDRDALPEIDSCVELFPTAEFHEREAYDFFGIVFRNHPDLRRILLPEDYAGWPQRRDFPIGGEPVLFTKDEPDSPGWYE